MVSVAYDFAYHSIDLYITVRSGFEFTIVVKFKFCCVDLTISTRLKLHEESFN